VLRDVKGLNRHFNVADPWTRGSESELGREGLKRKLQTKRDPSFVGEENFRHREKSGGS